MRFMATENWFWHGLFYEASVERPHVFDFPPTEVPSSRWIPLDEEAEAALLALAEKTEQDTGNRIIVRRLIRTEAKFKAEKIEAPPPPPEPSLPVAAQPAIEQPAMSEMQGMDLSRQPKPTVGKGKRPSDKEPI